MEVREGVVYWLVDGDREGSNYCIVRLLLEYGPPLSLTSLPP